MSLANLSDVLQPALNDNYAIAGLVVLGWEDALAFVEAAEETQIPIILQAGPGCRAHTPLPILAKMFRHLAESASVPIVCHLDHGYHADECFAAIDEGFSSVMFDGSKLPVEENIAITSKIIERAKPANVSVEGEVGFVGYAEGAASSFSSADEVTLYEKETGADAIAISIGNVHLQTEKTDGIDYDALTKIEAKISTPLVLHGGSGINSADRRKLSAATKVCKFNIGTELRMAFGSALRKNLAENPEAFDRIGLLKAGIPDVRDLTAHIIRELRYPEIA